MADLPHFSFLLCVQELPQPVKELQTNISWAAISVSDLEFGHLLGKGWHSQFLLPPLLISWFRVFIYIACLIYCVNIFKFLVIFVVVLQEARAKFSGQSCEAALWR